MWKRSISILFIVLMLVTSSVSVLAHTAKIEVGGENRYKAVRLTPEVYNASNSSLSDLLIKDSSGENVPYFINTGLKDTYSNRETYQMVLINSYLEDDSFYFDYKLAVAQSSDTISTSIEFATRNSNFAKEVDVYGSYDNVHWDYVQKDKIYSIDDKIKLTIEFIQPQKFTHYRLELANNLEQITFNAVNLIYSIETSDETYFIESLSPEFTIESGDKRTDITIEGLKNLRLCDITIYTDSMFKRNVNTQHGITKEIYNLSLNGTSYADTTIPLNWNIPQDETYTITIWDDDDKPIDISSIVVRYYADEIVFEGKTGEAYTLEFGRDATHAAPVYDIERYKDDILNGTIDKAIIGEVNYDAEIIDPARDYKLVFNIIIIVVTLLLGTVIMLKLKKK